MRQTRLPRGAFLAAELLSPFPSGCLCTASSSPLPRVALQTPRSSAQPLSVPLRLGHAALWHDRLWRSHSVLPATDGVLCSPQGPQSSLLSQLTSSAVRGFPGCGNLSAASAPRQGRRSRPTSSFLFVSFSLFRPTRLHMDLFLSF